MSFRINHKLWIGGAAALLLMIPAMADDLAGMKAFKSGDYKAAYNEWKPLADKGDANAQCNLGIMFRNGLGVDKDAAEAFHLFQASADKGNAQAQYQLAQMYAKGWGVPQNYSSALLWTQKSAAAGDPDGENRMGWLYDEGYGVQKDAKQAAYFYRLAAEKGNADAQFSLGLAYEKGIRCPEGQCRGGEVAEAGGEAGGREGSVGAGCDVAKRAVGYEEVASVIQPHA